MTQSQLFLFNPRTLVEQTIKPMTKKSLLLVLNSLCKILWLYAFCLLGGDLRAQTIISGPTTSGTWSPSGNPFIIAGNCSVANNQVLTIEPGVIVWIGSNLTLTVNGYNSSGIQAVGTPSQRITIQSASSSYYFNQILIENVSEYTNRFKYCDFANAQTAIVMDVVGLNQITEVLRGLPSVATTTQNVKFDGNQIRAR